MASTWAVFISLGVATVFAGSTTATTLHLTHTTTTTLTTKNVSSKPDTSKTIYNLSQPLVHETVQLLLPTEDEDSLAVETGDVGSEKPSVSKETEDVGSEEPSVSKESGDVGREEPSVSKETGDVGREEPSVSKETGDVGREEPSVSKETEDVGREEPSVSKETGDVGREEPSVSKETGDATTGPPHHHALGVKKDKDPLDISDKEGNVEGERGNNELTDISDSEGDVEAEGRNNEEDGHSRKAEYEELPVPMAQTVVGYTRDDETYIVNDEDGVACVMAFFKAKITIYYQDTKGDYQSNRVSPSDDAKVSGTCDRVGKVSQLDVLWSSYVLSLRFGLDDLSDSWFVSRFSLTYNLSDPDFTDAAPGGGEVNVISQDDRRYWQTSNDQSFRCLLLHDVTLTDNLNNTATLHFDEVRVQAFCNEDIFRAPKHCIHRVHRDEMVPVTVGAALAGSTLLTVIGYAIFRYFKVKKVQYDTME